MGAHVQFRERSRRGGGVLFHGVAPPFYEVNMNEYESLLRDREFFGEMVKLGENIATLEKARGMKFSHSTSDFLEQFAMLEAEAAAKIAAHEAGMARAVDGPLAEDVWLEEAMGPRPLDAARVFAAYVKRQIAEADARCYWEPADAR